MMYKDSTILNSIRNYVSNSMQNEMFVNAQLAFLGNTNIKLDSMNEDNVKYITCGSSVCGLNEKPFYQIVKWS